jgi:hypothetical protein
MKIVCNLLFIHLWSFAIKLCFIFWNKISQNIYKWIRFLVMSGFLPNNVRDPRSHDPNFLDQAVKMQQSGEGIKSIGSSYER